MINKFEKLDAWKYSKDLAVEIYKITDQYPKSEIFALSNQTNRAVVSISANVAEGCSRDSKRDFTHFLEIALGSAFELKTLIEIAYSRKYLGYKSKNEIDDMIIKCVKLIYGLKRSLHE
jgi:four helix bundle protein